MKKFLCLFFFLIYNISNFAQLADHIVIAEVYGGGGGTGATYKYDYIVLYNPTLTSVDLSSCSVQYASATSSSWAVTPLTGSIPSQSYYLIQEKAGSRGNELPLTPAVIGSISIAFSAGKVALVNSVDPLTSANPFGLPNLIDLVGYGTANGYENTPMRGPSDASQGLRRKDNSGNSTYGSSGSGWDSDNNLDDFYIQVIDSSFSPLPVELSSFNASIIENNFVQLNWQTETEINNFGFEIQRADKWAVDWKELGFVAGNGTSNSKRIYCFIDKNILDTQKYFYRLKQIDQNGSFSFSEIKQISLALPALFEVFQNYPNPFNPSTVIRYNLNTDNFISIKVFDILGSEVASLVNEFQTAGRHYVEFNSSQTKRIKSLASGIYYYVINAYSADGKKNLSETRKMLLLK